MEMRGKEYAVASTGAGRAIDDLKRIHHGGRDFLRKCGADLSKVSVQCTRMRDGKVLMRTIDRATGKEWRAGEALPGARATAGATPRAAAPASNPDASLLGQRLKRACDPRTKHIAAAVKAEQAGRPRLAEARRRLAEVARPLSEIEADRDQVIAGLRERASQKEIDRREAEARGDDWRYCQLTREIESLQTRIHEIQTSKPIA